MLYYLSSNVFLRSDIWRNVIPMKVPRKKENTKDDDFFMV